MTTHRRTFLKKSVKLATTGLLLPQLPIFADDNNLTEIPSENETNTYQGSRYGTIDQHWPDKEPTGEKFVFIRLKYPGGDWYTNLVDYYRWPSDLRFTQMLDRQTNIDVALYSNPQFVSIDDDCLFAYPYLFVTGHVGFRFSQEQKWRLKEYLERGGFLHIEDCDVRLNGGRGFMREAVRLLIKELFPEKKVERLDLSHPIYHSIYDHNEYLGGDKLVKPYGYYDEAVIFDDRIGIYFCPSDLNCAWEGRPCSPGGEEQRQWAFEQGMNVVGYALS